MIKIKTSGTFAMLALASAGILAAAFLVLVTDYLSDASNSIKESVESIYGAQELEVALLLHNRAAFLAELTNDDAHAARRAALKDDIERRLAHLHVHVSTAGEGASLERVETATRTYLRERERQEVAEPTVAYAEARKLLQATFSEIEGFVQVNRAQADAFFTGVTNRERLADRVGGAVVVLLVVGTAGFLLISVRLIYEPMIAISGAIRTYARGALHVRAPVRGVHELQSVSSAFNDMADTLARHRENQMRFLASVAHDLRSPLNAIRIAAELLANGALAEDKRASMADTVRRQASHLEHMVRDLLDTTRVEAGELDLRLERGDVRSLAHEAVSLFRPAAGKHRLKVEVPETPVWCRYDPHRIAQALNNLVSNALKYSPLGGEVTISVRREREAAVISVEDQGMGIAEEDRQRIFEPFRRSAATRDTVPGVGLGLCVARKIVEMHGGRIECASESGVGTTFEVSLPLEPSGALQGAHRSSASPSFVALAG